MKTLKFAIIGVGRIGKMHAANISQNSKSEIECIYDINYKLANEVANLHKASAVKTVEEAINNERVDAVLICSATPTHTKYILSAAKAGKAIFCEKPIDLDIKKVNDCRKKLQKYKVPIQIGFNRRFDPSHNSAIERKNNGEIGKLEKIIITSRDPKPPPADYIKVSGGMFRDMTIHDFDLASFILKNDTIDKIFAMGEKLFSKDVKNNNDIDTAMIIMKSKSGVLCHINNSRHSSYGYDQRIELFGSKGMLISDNHTVNSVKKFNKSQTNSKELVLNFFIERYENAFKNQLNSFINSVINKQKTLVTFEDGRNAIIIANAAYKSMHTGKSIKIKY